MQPTIVQQKGCFGASVKISFGVIREELRRSLGVVEETIYFLHIPGVDLANNNKQTNKVSRGRVVAYRAVFSLIRKKKTSYIYFQFFCTTTKNLLRVWQRTEWDTNHKHEPRVFVQ